MSRNLFMYDLSPMRPWETELMDAAVWNTAMTDRAAYAKGVDQARREAAGKGKVVEMLATKQGRPEA